MEIAFIGCMAALYVSCFLFPFQLQLSLRTEKTTVNCVEESLEDFKDCDPMKLLYDE